MSKIEGCTQELLFFARLFADLTAPSPDYDALKQVYWNRVYRIYDRLPDHVDPRPRGNTERLVRHFMGLDLTPRLRAAEVIGQSPDAGFHVSSEGQPGLASPPCNLSSAPCD
jgi:hypothetical protein